jgi:hypothetical protein
MRRHRGMIEQDGPLMSIPQAIRPRPSPHVGGQFGRIHIDGDGVEIGEEEQALGLALHRRPALDRAEIIAEVEIAVGWMPETMRISLLPSCG